MTTPRQSELWPDATPAEAPGFKDPAFMANRKQPVHRWVPWIAGYSQQFVADALARYLPDYGTVLDPFAGVGTTLVEADRVGHTAIGFEINPYAAFACATKLKAHRIDPVGLHRSVCAFREFHAEAEASGMAPRTVPPTGFRTRAAFYSPKVLRKVLLAHDFMAAQSDQAVADAFRLAFAATMVGYSNYSYEPSLGRKSAVGRPDVDDYPVMETIAAKVGQMATDCVGYAEERDRRPRQDGYVHHESFLPNQEGRETGYRRLDENSIDLLITSPPYLNNYHYNRNTRPHLYWLGFCEEPGDLKPLETQNFGTYWQNARDRDHVALDPAIDDAEIRDTLDEIRARNPEKGIYGGTGWANYAAQYFNDCARFAAGAKWCLKPGGTALVVIGNSILQGVDVPTDRFLARIAETQGLEAVGIHIPRDTRVGNSIVDSTVRAGKTAKATRLYESVVELRQP